jgi:hypothetical protein
MTPETLSGLVGLVLPPFIDIINVRITNTRVRFLVSLLVCLVVGLLTVLVVDGIDLQNPASILLSGASAFTTAQITYKQYYEDSKARETLKTTLVK